MSQVCEVTEGIPMALHLAGACIKSGADSLSVLEQSSAIGRSLRSCITRIKKLTPEISGEYINRQLFCFYFLLFRI